MLAALFVFLLTPNDDHDVIETALLSLFMREVWHSSDWSPKDYVVLLPDYSQEPETDFTSQFGRMREHALQFLAYYHKPKKDKDPRDVAFVAYLESTIAAFGKANLVLKESGTFKREKLSALRSFRWDKRIKVTEKSNWYFDVRRSTEARYDSKLEEHTIYAYPRRPTYSTNGKLAIVNFSIPWSVHSADVNILLKRTEQGWQKLLATSIFYL